ncbi:SRPBCC family protein [Paracoccus siganidrum]|uniref:Polyketide cyclase n=1 Tax=Paracoccus siganidrum TaxID=1276757 RepID=A0A419A8F7_9RHOB|nr:SRPBCC family protein [Paracoccus siganidrum]RJL18208.1 polyketide cyclase [Paracoccus siganidrum]RMC33385.1 polyketide cyclase [Paracoccus siganidrum]
MPKNVVTVDGNDLVISRHLDAPPDRIWRAWVEPDQLRQWFAPKPVEVLRAALEPRPGGICDIAMRMPDGTEIDQGPGCVLLAEPNHKLIWTDALGPEFRPTGTGFITVIVLMDPEEGGGTRYSARVLHKDEADRRKHEEMGFAEGWGQCLDQLAALVEG